MHNTYWPSSIDYDEAVQNPSVFFNDEDLKQGDILLDEGLPRVYTGGFAYVYQVTSKDGRKWAVRCFQRRYADSQERYSAISTHLQKKKLPCVVDFIYQPSGILIRGQWYPILKMEWIDGQPLDQYIPRILQQEPKKLLDFASTWIDLIGILKNEGIAHGDLHHGNVLVTSSGDLKLVDYDDMFVPALKTAKRHGMGYPAYQHPKTTALDYNYNIDQFSALVIYLSIIALSIDPSLLTKYNAFDHENFLFREDDYRYPENSALFKELLSFDDARIKSLTEALRVACYNSVDTIPDLLQIVGTSKNLTGTIEGKEDTKFNDSSTHDRETEFVDSIPPIPAILIQEIEQPPSEKAILLWKFKTGGCIDSSPQFSDGRIYVTSFDKHVYCLDSISSNLIWKYKTGANISSSPVVVGDRLYIGSHDKHVFCLDATHGTLIWKYETRDFVSSTPTVIGDRLYIGSHDKHVYCLDATHGTLIWKYETGDNITSSPIVSDSRIYIGSYDHHVYCLNTAHGNLIWKHKTGNIISSSPTIHENRLYIGSDDSKIYCLDAVHGSLIWGYMTGGLIESSPTIWGNGLYVGSRDNHVYCLDATHGNLIWRYEANDWVSSSPVVNNDRLYIGSWDQHVYCLEPTKGKLIWKYKTGKIAYSSPMVSQNRLFIGSTDHHIYCLDYHAQSDINAISPQNTDVNNFTYTNKEIRRPEIPVGQNPYSCPVCDSKIDQKTGLCTYCGNSASPDWQHSEEVKNYISDINIPVTVDNEQYSLIQEEPRNNDKKRTYQCPICGERVSPDAVKSGKCAFCGYVGTMEYDVKQHATSSRPSATPLQQQRFTFTQQPTPQLTNEPPDVASTTVVCPNCGATNSPDTKFCQQCGYRFGTRLMSTTEWSAAVASQATGISKSNLLNTKISLLSPIGGEHWKPDSTYTIKWDCQNYNGDIKIDLVKGKKSINLISIPSTLKSFSWRIPKFEKGGNSYHIAIRYSNSNEVACVSSKFTIVSDLMINRINSFSRHYCSWCKKFYTNGPWLCIYRKIEPGCKFRDLLSDSEKASKLEDDTYWWLIFDEMSKIKK